jgi:hypothetical protein
VVVYNPCGGENGPVTVAAFKAADSVLRGSNGGFDSHTPPPTNIQCLCVPAAAGKESHAAKTLSPIRPRGCLLRSP